MEKGVTPEKPSGREVREMILEHAAMQIACKGEYTGMREMRKHVAWYTTGYPHSARIRQQVCEVETIEELRRIMDILWQ